MKKGSRRGRAANERPMLLDANNPLDKGFIKSLARATESTEEQGTGNKKKDADKQHPFINHYLKIN